MEADFRRWRWWWIWFCTCRVQRYLGDIQIEILNRQIDDPGVWRDRLELKVCFWEHSAQDNNGTHESGQGHLIRLWTVTKAPSGNLVLKGHAEEEWPALTSVETCNESSTLSNRDATSDVDESKSQGRIKIVMH